VSRNFFRQTEYLFLGIGEIPYRRYSPRTPFGADQVRFLNRRCIPHGGMSKINDLWGKICLKVRMRKDKRDFAASPAFAWDFSFATIFVLLSPL